MLKRWMEERKYFDNETQNFWTDKARTNVFLKKRPSDLIIKVVAS